MVVTEEQAKKRECVEAITLPDPFPCMGPKCMAWRWWGRDWFSSNKTHGFCGKAGIPKVAEPEEEIDKPN